MRWAAGIAGRGAAVQGLRAGLVLAGLAGLPWQGALAALPDEIQVYDDGLNAAGDVGVELHLNATPSADPAPAYPGEITTVHGLRQTFEFSYGVTNTVELGLYIPLEYTAQGQERYAGPRARLKYIAQQASAEDPWFYGINFELSHVKYVFEAAQDFLEVRPIIGWRNDDWLVSGNPVVGIPLLAGQRTGGPDFSPALKVARTLAPGFAGGFEYYTALGQFSNLLPYSQQTHTLFAAIDVDRKPWVFNLGIGRGLTAAADRWTIKALFELPI